ncbi:MAG: NAD(P)H-dependent oxidoreductase subunit E [Sphingopyxis sp.]
MTDADKLSEIIADHAPVQASLLPILHDVQAALGCVDGGAEAAIAAALNLSRAEVHGVVSFYHDFTPVADARPCIELCEAEACQARGSEATSAAARGAAGARISIKTVYCLGLCSVGPAARVGGTLHARLDPASMAHLVQSL